MNAFEAATVDRAVRAGYGFGMYQHLEEIAALCRLLCRHDVRRVLEIGMHRGGTAACFAELAPDLVVSIDKHDGLWGGIGAIAADLRDHTVRAAYPQWKVVRGDSHDPATVSAVRDLMDGVPFDFLFIDGDHSQAGVTADFLDYRGLVRQGGLIGFHDVADTEEHRRVGCEVDRLWADLKAGRHGFYACEDLTVPGLPWGGIGVVHA